MSYPYKEWVEMGRDTLGPLFRAAQAYAFREGGSETLTKTQKRKEMQADQLPVGINSLSRNYYLKGRTLKRSSGKGWWQQQTSDMVSTDTYTIPLAGGGTIAPKSGTQVVKTLAYMWSAEDFAQTGVATPDEDNPYVNLFALNPYQQTTGSSTPSGVAVIAAGRPSDDAINIHGARLIIDYHNTTNNPTYLKFYVAVAKQDNADGPVDSWSYGNQQYVGGGYARHGSTAVWDYGTYDRTIVHTVPQSSQYFNQKWKIIGVIPCQLASGADCKVNIHVKQEKTYTYSYVNRLRTLSVKYPKGTVCVFVVQHGGVIYSTAEGSEGPNFGYTKCAYVTTKKYLLGFCEPNDRILPVAQGVNLPVGIDVATDKQGRMAEDAVSFVKAIVEP